MCKGKYIESTLEVKSKIIVHNKFKYNESVAL